ncbi:redoxin domain-containing protein [Nesterenkonia rhizosphaerae]|uniref:Peroxiredoxin n=1 Tax=Nesterenkonia rhizosphaerae TaxID=1348272 RepID=A0ABP9G1P2_9MICC
MAVPGLPQPVPPRPLGLRPAHGAPAPDFTARTHHGEHLQLSALAAGPVLVMFYPFAFSRVCGSELHEMVSRWSELEPTGVRVLAISCDAVHTLRAYAEHLQLGSLPAAASSGGPGRAELSLLSDFWPHGQIAQNYGVFNPVTGAPSRVSYLLDDQLVVREVIEADDGDARDFDQILHRLRRLE